MAHIEKRTLADGSSRYHVRYRVDGKARRKVFKRRADADAFRRKVEGEELAGLVVDPKGGERAFGPFATAWVDSRLVKGRPLTPATRQGYLGLLRRRLVPEFGRAPLRKITPERVRHWYASVTKEHGADQAAKAYRLLRAILSTAVADRLLSQNPCTLKGAGIEAAAERPLVDTSTVLDLAEAMPERLRVLVLLAGFGGLRTGELLGLERRDVDTLHRAVTVRQQAHEIAGMGRTITEPKSEAGKRTVELPGTVIAVLGEHLDAYVAPGPDASVFTSPSGRPLRRADLSEAWTEAKEIVGVDDGTRIHDLRHHAATNAARKPGITTKELMVRIGHASPVAALRYQHAAAERDREVADHLEAIIAAAESERSGRAPVVNLPRPPRVPASGEGPS